MGRPKKSAAKDPVQTNGQRRIHVVCPDEMVEAINEYRANNREAGKAPPSMCEVFRKGIELLLGKEAPTGKRTRKPRAKAA